MNPVSKEEWFKCQVYEKESWGDNIYVSNENCEVIKQNTYAKLMGLTNNDQFTELDMQQKTILDVGCGPVSLLLRCKNFKRAVGVEPIFYGNEVDECYKKHGVELLHIPAEEMNFHVNEFDEVWMYNVLQHVYDPDLILKNILHCGKKFRIFEWIDIPPHEGHPHMLTAAWFIDKLGLKPHEYIVVYLNTDHEIGQLVGKAICIVK